MSIIHTATNGQGELLYCLDDIREFLTFENILSVSARFIKGGQKIYGVPAAKNTPQCRTSSCGSGG